MSENEDTRSLLVRGVAAAKTNDPRDKQEARFYLEWVLRLDDATTDQKAEAWLWLSQVEEDVAKKRECLENVLVMDPSNALARRGMAILDGKLNPKDVIDDRQPIKPVSPDVAPQTASAPGQGDRVRRYVCPKCAGKMVFDPQKRQLTCVACGNHLYEYQAIQQGALVPVVEQDFIAALPTAKAHRWELPAERVLKCEGCGATFALPPLQISGACPYCGSAHVVETVTDELIQPEGVLPFQFDADAALKHIRVWLDQQRFRPGDLDERAGIARPRGVYLPFWTFDLGGQMNWNALVAEQQGRDTKWVARDGFHLVYHDDLLVPGTHSLRNDLLNVMSDFDTKALVPYALDLLADWPVEVYQISMSDASLVARQIALNQAREHTLSHSLAGERVRDLRFNTMGMIIETYKLALLPVWVTNYRYKDNRYPLLVNGQTGTIGGDVPRSGLQKAMAGLFGKD